MVLPKLREDINDSSKCIPSVDTDDTIDKWLPYNSIMLTSDGPVHFRNTMFGVPSALTGSKSHVLNGRIYVPITDFKQKLRTMIGSMADTFTSQNANFRNKFNTCLTEHSSGNFQVYVLRFPESSRIGRSTRSTRSSSSSSSTPKYEPISTERLRRT